jgi:hypothetical protein
MEILNLCLRLLSFILAFIPSQTPRASMARLAKPPPLSQSSRLARLARLVISLSAKSHAFPPFYGAARLQPHRRLSCLSQRNPRSFMLLSISASRQSIHCPLRMYCLECAFGQALGSERPFLHLITSFEICLHFSYSIRAN